MDLTSTTTVTTVALLRECGEVSCGVCPECHRKAMRNMASYALKTEDPEGTLRLLLAKLGLADQQCEDSGRKR